MNSKTTRFGINSVADIAKVAVIAALYVVVTTVLAAFSFGAVQVRLAEMLNLLAIYNKRYVIAVPLGVAISNLASPNGIIDVIWGSLSTFVTMLVLYYVAKHISNFYAKLVVGVLIVTFSMFTIALELAWIGNAAFWPTFWMDWGTIAIGELISLTIGAILLVLMGFRIDLNKLFN